MPYLSRSLFELCVLIEFVKVLDCDISNKIETMIFEHTYVFEFILCAETFYETPFIIAVHRQQMVKLCRMHNICLFNLLANLPVCASYKEDRVKAGLGGFHL